MRTCKKILAIFLEKCVISRHLGSRRMLALAIKIKWFIKTLQQLRISFAYDVVRRLERNDMGHAAGLSGP